MKNIKLLAFIALFLGVSKVSAQFPIFDEAYAPDISFVKFDFALGSVNVDETVAHTGTKSLKIGFLGNPSRFMGGAFVAAIPQDLSAYNALSFWIKGSDNKTLDFSGIGFRGTTTSLRSERLNVDVTTTWTKVIIPIPDPSKFNYQSGLFYFSENLVEGFYDVWIDDLKYETLPVGTASATIVAESFVKNIGETFSPSQGGTCSFSGVPGATFNIGYGMFTYSSANPSIATMNSTTGVGTGVGSGATTIVAKLGAVTATGGLLNVTINGNGSSTPPTTPAPTPPHLQENVKSLYSDAYTYASFANLRADWSIGGSIYDRTIAGNNTILYENVNSVGITFEGGGGDFPINATLMKGLHLDIWTPDALGSDLRVKLVDFGADGKLGGGDDSNSGEIPFPAPGITAGTWAAFDVPLSAFMGAGKLTARGHLAQLVLITSPNKTIWMDNVYFYRDPVSDAPPPIAAPTPTLPQSKVISL
jgi:hypothetical protein